MRRHYPFDTAVYPLWLVLSVAVGILIGVSPVYFGGGNTTSANIASYVGYALFFHTFVLGVSSFTRWFWQLNMLALCGLWAFTAWIVMGYVPYTVGETAMEHLLRSWQPFALLIVPVMLPAILFYVLCKNSPRQAFPTPEALADECVY